MSSDAHAIKACLSIGGQSSLKRGDIVKILLAVSPDFTESMVDRLLREFDKRGTGAVDIDEFVNFLFGFDCTQAKQCNKRIVFFDCDDTLYSDEFMTMNNLNTKFGSYCSEQFGLPESKMLDLYKTYGTTLCGLIKEGHIKEDQVNIFLEAVHQVPLDHIKPDHTLRGMLLSIPHDRWVFTAATLDHAQRCLSRLGVEDCFSGIIACSSPEVFQKAGYVSKHDPRCFEFAMQRAGVSPEHASRCVLLDDSASNLKTAKQMGWTTVLVGLYTRTGAKSDQTNADHVVGHVHEIVHAMPKLFAH